MYDTEYEESQDIKVAILLAKTQYNQKFQKWVKGSKHRLEYIDDEITNLASESAQEMDANFARVEAGLRLVIADEVESYGNPDFRPIAPLNADAPVAVTDPERSSLSLDGDSEPYENSTEVPGFIKMDITGDSTVLEEDSAVRVDLKGDSLKQGAYSEAGDLNDPNTWHPCYRCGSGLNPIVAKVSPVCAKCNEDLIKLADPNMLGQVPCPFPMCVWKGQQSELATHMQQAHPGQAPPTGGGTTAMGSVETLDLRDESVQASFLEHVGAPSGINDPSDLQTASPPVADPELSPTQDPNNLEDKSQPHHNDSANPVDAFNDAVTNMANIQAAKDWSTPTEEDIHSISEQLGLDPNIVHQNLVITAQFGNVHGKNGQLVDQSEDHIDQNLTPVEGFGGEIPGEKARQEVSVQAAVQVAAEQSGLDPNDLYNSIIDSYGDDLGDKYFISVQGNAQYLLPSSVMGGVEQQTPTPNDPMNETADEAQQRHDQTAEDFRQRQQSSVLRFASFRDLIEWER